MAASTIEYRVIVIVQQAESSKLSTCASFREADSACHNEHANGGSSRLHGGRLDGCTPRSAPVAAQLNLQPAHGMTAAGSNVLWMGGSS